MDLAGKTTTLGLAEVFQNIAFNNHTGSLTLKQGDQKAQIAFEGGRIRAVKVHGADFDYLDIARRCQLASEEVLAKAEGSNLKRTLRAYLLASGDLDEERYDATIAGYVEDAILPLFGWKAAAFSFEEGKLKTRVFDGTEWSALVEAEFSVEYPSDLTLAVTEVHYNPFDPSDAEQAAGFDDKDDFEYIELINTGPAPIDFRGVHFTAGLDFTFGAITLDPGAYVVVVRNKAAFEFR